MRSGHRGLGGGVRAARLQVRVDVHRLLLLRDELLDLLVDKLLELHCLVVVVVELLDGLPPFDPELRIACGIIMTWTGSEEAAPAARGGEADAAACRMQRGTSVAHL